MENAATTYKEDERPCDKLLDMWCDFLVTHAAKQADIKVSGKARKRAPGETGYPVHDLHAQSTDEAV